MLVLALVLTVLLLARVVLLLLRVVVSSASAGVRARGGGRGLRDQRTGCALGPSEQRRRRLGEGQVGRRPALVVSVIVDAERWLRAIAASC